MTAEELIQRCRPRATPEGRQRASADATLAYEALGTAQRAREQAEKAGVDAIARLREVADRVSGLNLELKNLRLMVTSEVNHGLDVSAGRYTSSITESLAKLLAKRAKAADERDALGETLVQLSDFLIMDGPKVHRAAVDEAQAGLTWLQHKSDVVCIDVLLASEPLLKIDPNLAIVSSTGSEIQQHVLAIANQVVALDEARKKLRDAESAAKEVAERS